MNEIQVMFSMQKESVFSLSICSARPTTDDGKTDVRVLFENQSGNQLISLIQFQLHYTLTPSVDCFGVIQVNFAFESNKMKVSVKWKVKESREMMMRWSKRLDWHESRDTTIQSAVRESIQLHFMHDMWSDWECLSLRNKRVMESFIFHERTDIYSWDCQETTGD